MTTLVLLGGPTGVGKTTFLSRLTGQMESLSVAVREVLQQTGRPTE